ncbi:unnamed protein product [Cochlearia groenlandica]
MELTKASVNPERSSSLFPYACISSNFATKIQESLSPSCAYLTDWYETIKGLDEAIPQNLLRRAIRVFVMEQLVRKRTLSSKLSSNG